MLFTRAILLVQNEAISTPEILRRRVLGTTADSLHPIYEWQQYALANEVIDRSKPLYFSYLLAPPNTPFVT